MKKNQRNKLGGRMAKLYLQSGDEWDKDLREDISLHSRRLQRKTRSASLS